MLALVAFALAAPGAAVEPPLCRARLALEPHEAYVGQPVLHRVLIEQRRDVADLRWEESLSFPAFRSEWIPSTTGPGTSEATLLVEERRVLFPARAGRLALPGAVLVCEGAGRVERVAIPPAELVALEPPAAGRPAGWQGLIGPVEITLYATPDRVTLGESVSVSVMVRGETNVWAAPAPFAGAFAPEQAELFDRPAELARDSGRRLELRQYYGFDLVPRRAGTLALPELHVPYFDPATRSFREARAPGVAIEVAPRAAEPPGPAAAAEPEPGAEDETMRPGAAVAVAVAALTALGGGAAGFWLARRGGPLAPRGSACAGPEPEREARARLAAALAARDATAAAAAATRALRLALEGVLPGARGGTAEELAERARDDAARALVALLARLETARFAETPGDLLALAREAEEHLVARS
jgi:hypothetical protein